MRAILFCIIAKWNPFIDEMTSSVMASILAFALLKRSHLEVCVDETMKSYTSQHTHSIVVYRVSVVLIIKRMKSDISSHLWGDPRQDS